MDLALNNLQRLICHKTNQTKQHKRNSPWYYYTPLTNGKEGCGYIPCLFVLYLFGLCISRLLLVLHVGSFILLWCETLFVFVSPFCNERVWSLKWTCLWLDVSAALIWTLFRLFDDPSGSWRMYVFLTDSLTTPGMEPILSNWSGYICIRSLVAFIHVAAGVWNASSFLTVQWRLISLSCSSDSSPSTAGSCTSTMWKVLT